MAASDPKDPVLSVLRTNDAALATVDFAKWYVPASDDAIAETKKHLEAKKHKVSVVHDAAEALALLKTLVKGEETFAAHSTTLNEIGFTDYAKTQSGEFTSLNSKIVAETDWAKVGELRRQAMGATNYLTSANAVGHDGSITIVDASGTRVGGVSYAAKKVIIVVGSNKIVKDVHEGYKRVHEFSLPTESARARVAYGVPGSAVNFQTTIHSGSPYGADRIHVVIIKQVLGF